MLSIGFPGYAGGSAGLSAEASDAPDGRAPGLGRLQGRGFAGNILSLENDKSVVMKRKLLLGVVLLFLILPRLQADAGADGAYGVRREHRQPECSDAGAVRLIESFYADYVLDRKSVV